MGIFTQFMYNLMEEQNMFDDKRMLVKGLIYMTVFIMSPVFFVGFVFVTISSLSNNFKNECKHRKKDKKTKEED